MIYVFLIEIDENKKLAKGIKSALKSEQEKTETAKSEFLWLRMSHFFLKIYY